MPLGLRVHRFACGDVQLLGCQQNVPEQSNQPLLFGKKRFVYDVRHGRDLGEIDRLVPAEHGGRNSLFTVSDRPLAGFSATMQSKSTRGSMIELVLSPAAKAGDLINRCLYRVAVFRPDGLEDETLRRFVWAEGKPITVSVPMAWNVAAGNWRLVATDLLTGRQQTVTYNLEAQP